MTEDDNDFKAAEWNDMEDNSTSLKEELSSYTLPVR